MTTPPPTTEERIAHIEGSFEQINNRLGTLELDVRSIRTEMNGKLDSLTVRMDRVETRVDRIDSRIDRLFYIQLGLIGAIVVATVAAVLTDLL